MRKRHALLPLLLLIAGFVFPQPGEKRSTSRIDWEGGMIALDVKVPLDLDHYPFPRARLEAEQRIEAERGALFLDAVQMIAIDSRQTIGDFLLAPSATNDPHLYLEALTGISALGVKRMSTVSENFASIEIVYEYSFFGPDGILTPLVTHPRPLPLPPVVGYSTSRTFTGLVIYAQGKFPAYGKRTETALRPALFPRIFSLSETGTIETVLEMPMVRPEALKKWGMLSYVNRADRDAYVRRAGSFPLEITVFAIYGNYDTDLVISREAALMLLSREENRELLRDGKIVVIIDQPSPS